MMHLPFDSLYFTTDNGESFPCSVEAVSVELIGESASQLDPTLIQNAAQAVLHYFKHDLGRHSVSVGEFSEALERVLRGLGLTVIAAARQTSENLPVYSDLRGLVLETGATLELDFYPRLRSELQRLVAGSPSMVRFTGLRNVVKTLAGAQRWNPRCRQLRDQIIGYLRHCLRTEVAVTNCILVVE